MPRAEQGNGCRIAITGGPGGGKTTAVDLLRREFGERVVVVPEAATILFGGGYPRRKERRLVKSTQRVIFQLQRSLELVQHVSYPDRVLLCDRGTVDGAAYWPSGDPEDFFDDVGTSLEAELGRYDAVLFFESAAVGGIGIEGGNPARIENLAEAAALDGRLRDLWSQHPRFCFVPHQISFFRKLHEGFEALRAVHEGLTNGD